MASFPAASSSADPLGQAIVAQGVDDQPLNETSSAPSHSVDAGVRQALQSGSAAEAGHSTSRKSEADHAEDTSAGEDDLVVYSEELSGLPEKSSLGKRVESNVSPSARHTRSVSNASTIRVSLESVSFGFRDNLLPLSLSRAEYDDEDSYDDQGLEQGKSNGRPGGHNDYGELEGNATPRTPSSRFRNARRYKDPERRMGLLDGIALTVGLQIGSGIFSSPGVVTLNTGSIGSSLIVWLFSGLLAWCGASSFAELGSAIPQNGGAQAYLNYSLGPLPSYLFSWTAIVALKPGSGAIIAIIFGEYLARIIFHATSSSADHPHEQGLEGIPSWSIKLIACLIVVCVSLLNALSARLGTRTQVATTIVKLGALVAVPILAIVFAARGKMPTPSREAFSSFTNLFAGSSTSPSSYALALYSGLWAFDGWDQTSYVAGEMKNVTRDLPRVIHTSMTLVVIFFTVTVISYFLALSPSLVMRTNTVALDFGSAVFGGSTAGGVVFACLVAFSCFGALNSQIYTSSRLVYAAGKEGYLPAVFGSVNKRTATPMAATAFQAALVLLFILFGSGFASLLSFYGVCAYTWYFLTVVGLLVLRVKEPHLERPYRTWLITPIIFSTTALFLLVMPVASAPLEAAAAVIFMLAGLPAYFVSTGMWKDKTSSFFLWRCCGGSRSDGRAALERDGDHLEDIEEGDEEEAMEMLQRRESHDSQGPSTHEPTSKSKGKQRASDQEGT